MAIPQAHPNRTTFGKFPSTVIGVVAIGGGWEFTLKEAADRAVALLALLLLAPLLLAIALGVRVSSIGPVIFRQRRVGRGGKAFVLFKFRTMVEDSGVAAFTLAHGTAPGGIEGTDRRTAVGRWLRAISLDELPQLVNVLRGEMSLIGPRPERPEYVELFANVVPGYTERHRVKPGITGWAQANGLRGQTSIADRVEFDNYYIENWSLALDLQILALTVVELLRFRDRRPDSLRDRSSQHTAVPSVGLAARVELACAGVTGDGSRGLSRHQPGLSSRVRGHRSCMIDHFRRDDCVISPASHGSISPCRPRRAVPMRSRPTDFMRLHAPGRSREATAEAACRQVAASSDDETDAGQRGEPALLFGEAGCLSREGRNPPATPLSSDGRGHPSKALGSERMERKLRDALPGGDGALRAAVWEFMRPTLSPALVELNRDAFVVNESAETTVDLDGHRAASDLDDEPGAEAA